jgi:hypothetical protein
MVPLVVFLAIGHEESAPVRRGRAHQHLVLHRAGARVQLPPQPHHQSLVMLLAGLLAKRNQSRARAS